MLQKIKNSAVALAMVFSFGAATLLPAPVLAANAIQNAVCEGTNAAVSGSAGNQTCDQGGNGKASLATIASTVVNYLSIIVGIIAVIMIIVGGFRYITSGGESSNVSGAKNTLIYAIVGLIIVALAQFIVRFVLSGAGGAVNNVS
jgi:predicted permease